MSRLFGGLLLGIGILIMTCSGLCSLVAVVIGFPAVLQAPVMILMPIFFGGLPFAIGFGLFKWGQQLLKQSAEPPRN